MTNILELLFARNTWADFIDGRSGSLTIVLAAIMFLAGILFVSSVMKRKSQGFGRHSIRALGIVLFLPILLAMTAVGEINGQTIATLLGTLAGYIFASGGNDKDDNNV